MAFMISLIGITGPAQHGKDTVGDMLKEIAMPTSQRFAFADKMKDFIHEAFKAPLGPEEAKETIQVFEVNSDVLYYAIEKHLWEALKHYDITPTRATSMLLNTLIKEHKDVSIVHDSLILKGMSWRKLYQVVGTQWGRQQISEDFWITPWLPSENTIVTDVRGYADTIEHHNIEATAIIDKGGIVIKVVDPRKGEVVRDHPSESGIYQQYIQHTIVNDGTLDDLRSKVMSFVNIYLLEGEQ